MRQILMRIDRRYTAQAFYCYTLAIMHKKVRACVGTIFAAHSFATAVYMYTYVPVQNVSISRKKNT